MTNFKHLFGPVPSRRLGVSLGVDFIPAKTCSLDCIYCESGPTTNLSTERCKFISPDKITAELDSFLSTEPSLDYITFSGAGEPTLYSELGQVNDFIKKNYPDLKTALLTNGTLFWREDVRKECYGIDLVFPSIDAGSEEIFKKINRPEKSLHIKKVLEGIREFALNYKGSLWLEVFVLPETNMTEKALEDIKNAVSKIPHEKIFLNTLDRPGSENGLKKASPEELEKIRSFFGEKTETATRKSAVKISYSLNKEKEETLLRTIKIRPLTREDIVAITGFSKNELAGCIRSLEKRGKIKRKKIENDTFFTISEKK